MTTTRERTEVQVGFVPRSREEWDSIPLGATFNRSPSYTAGPRTYTMEWDEARGRKYMHIQGRDGQTLHRTPTSRLRTDGVFAVSALPQPERFSVGWEFATREEFHECPVGTKWATPRGTEWTKTGHDKATSENGSVRSLSVFSANGTKVIATPADITVEATPAEPTEPQAGVECPVEPETPMEYAQRFETTMYGAATARGVGTERHSEAMHRVGAPNSADPEVWCVGMWVWSQDQRTLSALPDGTLLEVGWDKDHFEKYGVYEVRGAGAAKVLGGNQATGIMDQGTLFRVLGFPAGTNHGDGSWRSQINTAEDAPPVERQTWDMMVVAYDRGMRVKRAASWCEEYERHQRKADLPADGMGEPPTFLTPEQVSALPVGSIVRYMTKGTCTFFIRDDSMTNPARTRRVGGGLPGDWTQYLTVEVRHGSETINIAPFHEREMEDMPSGTTIRIGRENYTLVRDEARWRRPVWESSGGSHNYTNDLVPYNMAHVHYTSFPGVE